MKATRYLLSVYLHSLCGIPSITLEGTPGDWQLLRERVGLFSRFGLSW